MSSAESSGASSALQTVTRISEARPGAPRMRFAYPGYGKSVAQGPPYGVSFFALFAPAKREQNPQASSISLESPMHNRRPIPMSLLALTIATALAACSQPSDAPQAPADTTA